MQENLIFLAFFCDFSCIYQKFVVTLQRQIKTNTNMSLIKGSENYKKAQSLANNIVWISSLTRGYKKYDDYMADFENFIYKIESLGVFASDIAKSVEATLDKDYRMARVSEKQSWIIACAAVENNINL